MAIYKMKCRDYLAQSELMTIRQFGKYVGRKFSRTERALLEHVLCFRQNIHERGRHMCFEGDRINPSLLFPENAIESCWQDLGGDHKIGDDCFKQRCKQYAHKGIVLHHYVETILEYLEKERRGLELCLDEYYDCEIGQMCEPDEEYVLDKELEQISLELRKVTGDYQNKCYAIDTIYLDKKMIVGKSELWPLYALQMVFDTSATGGIYGIQERDEAGVEPIVSSESYADWLARN